MALLVIPVDPNESNQEQITALDGVDFLIRLLYNQRSGAHYLTIRNASGDDLITAFKVVPDIPFAVHIVGEGLPAGQIWIVGADISGEAVGLRELSKRVYLMYVDEEANN